MNSESKVTLFNYSMAIGRIGLGIVFIPILLALSYMLFIERQSSILMSLALICLCIPFVWLAVTVPLTVEFGNRVLIRYMFLQSEYPRDNVQSICFSEIHTTFGFASLIPDIEAGHRTHSVGTVTLNNRNTFCMKVDEHQIQLLRNWFESSKT